jgi:Tfp pilus assembly protein PilP
MNGNERTMRSAITLGLGILFAAAVPGTLAQVKLSTPNSVKSALQGGTKPAQQPATKPAAKPAAPAATKPAPAAAKSAAKPAVKSSTKSVAKKAPAPLAAKKVEKAGAPRKTAPAESEVRMARRDPFESLVGRQQGKGAPNLPPGKAGLQVSTLRLDGIVKSPNGMIAVVSNPQARTYFLREGDHLFDGSVEKISMDGVSFHEEGKDAFGKPMERQVNKRIYSSPGEQQ